MCAELEDYKALNSRSLAMSSLCFSIYKHNQDDHCCANAKLGAGWKSFTAFFTASMSMSPSFPVADVTILQLLFSSAYGRNSLAFSLEENSATLDKKTRNGTWREQFICKDARLNNCTI
jgi:hypothetical protein